MGSVSWASGFVLGHQLTAGEFEPHISAVRTVFFGSSVPFSLCHSPAHILSVSLSVSLRQKIKKTHYIVVTVINNYLDPNYYVEILVPPFHL